VIIEGEALNTSTRVLSLAGYFMIILQLRITTITWGDEKESFESSIE
jgi:hypothetical protein